MKLFFIALVITTMLLAGCATVPKIKYIKNFTIQLPDKPEAELTINDVTVNITPMNVSKELMDQKYNKKFTVYYTPYFAPIYETFERKINFFNGTTPYEVTITNNTDQILKMLETRVMYLDPITESPAEPYMALDLGTIIQNPNVLPVFDELVNSFSSLKPQSQNHVVQIGNEIVSLAKQMKIVNQPSREIMPGMKYTGIIIIPISSQKITEGKLSFVDMVTKSATAGYATEKVRYDFTVRKIEKYWKQDKSISKDWLEITSEEYNTGTAKK